MSSYKVNWLSVGQFTFSALALTGLWSLAAGLAAIGLAQAFYPSPLFENELPLFMMAATFGFIGLLLLPSAYFALQDLIGRPITIRMPRFSWLRPVLLLPLLALALLVGYLATQAENLTWLLLPPVHVLAIAIPIFLLVSLAGRGLPLGSPQRYWGVFGSGLVLGPALILLAELAALVVFVVLAVMAVSSNPDLLAQMTRLAEEIGFESVSPERAIELLGPYLLRPGVLLSVLTFGAVVVPLIEELAKPIGVWLLAGKELTPAAGFAAGLLSGAGYALFESMALTSGAGEWLFLVLARIGTAVIHILTAGITGWALALAWQRGRYATLAGAYLASVAIHGLWNALALVATFSAITLELGEPQPDLLARLAPLVPYVLGVLVLGGLVGLRLANRSLRKEAAG